MPPLTLDDPRCRRCKHRQSEHGWPSGSPSCRHGVKTWGGQVRITCECGRFVP
jgi:hypothetical protein